MLQISAGQVHPKHELLKFRKSSWNAGAIICGNTATRPPCSTLALFMCQPLLETRSWSVGSHGFMFLCRIIAPCKACPSAWNVLLPLWLAGLARTKLPSVHLASCYKKDMKLSQAWQETPPSSCPSGPEEHINRVLCVSHVHAPFWLLQRWTKGKREPCCSCCWSG